MKRLLFLSLFFATTAEAQFTDFSGNRLPQPTIPYFGNHGEIEFRQLQACDFKPVNDPCYDAYWNWIACGNSLNATAVELWNEQAENERLTALLEKCRKSKGKKCK